MKKLKGQLIYVGPMFPQIGLQRGCIFKNGVHKNFYKLFESCPAFGELFVPIAKYAAIRRELAFDIGRQMCGTTGKYVTFYHEVENWLAKRAKKTNETTNTGVKIHA